MFLIFFIRIQPFRKNLLSYYCFLIKNLPKYEVQLACDAVGRWLVSDFIPRKSQRIGNRTLNSESALKIMPACEI